MEDKSHRCHYRVLYGDTDAAAVVYNANYLRFFEIGRTELMRENVCSYREIEELGLLFPVIECYTRFKAPARYDDLLIIETRLSELQKITCKFTYKILRKESATGKELLLAKGHTLHASINRKGKLTPLPTNIIPLLQALLPETA
ncbi:MAG: acyl-CoA thioesterase [Proteobacteria bacterium]|nr:acyl-CoA thioesterase [Pseudomonadota bacterium]MBU1455662.1 acyl-CoA thioesterase [Pseudomonadota bacterium]